MTEPAAGVPFTGFEFAKIESRKSVMGDLRNFMKYCRNEAKSPTVCVILGEWGEGKTEAFQRYIEPSKTRGFHAYPYLVSASTVGQSFTKVASESPVAATNFLAAVLYSVQEETRAERVPPRVRYVGTDEWLEATLDSHSDGRIFIFIDEFEELLLDPNSLKLILSGLKETVNGQFKPIAQGGKYEGAIHFILSCTPDAYYRMRGDPGVDQIFGSFERRINIIKLNPVSKSEGVTFLNDLICYAYQDEIPTPTPLKSTGIWHTLQTICRGNLGALVTLFTRVMNKAVTEENRLRIIDGHWLIDSLSDEYISIYGGSTRCVEKSVVAEIQKVLAAEDELGLFRMLVGELKPFRLEEIRDRLNLADESEALKLVSTVNEKLKEHGVSQGILQLAPFKEGTSFQQVSNRLQEEISEDELRVDGFAQPLTELEDECTHVDFEGGVLAPMFLFPWDARAIQASLEGVTLESANRLQRRLEPIIEPSHIYYRLSNELVLRLFPTPIPIGLEFIKDREFRLRMWRRATTQFSDLFEQNMPQAALALLKYAQPLNVVVDDYHSIGGGCKAVLEEKAWHARISAYCVAYAGDVSPEAIRRISQDFSKVKPVHAIILFHVGEFTNDAWEEVRVRDLEDYILPVPLHPNLAKRLVIMYDMKRRHPDQVDERLFSDAVSQLYKVDIDIEQRLETWLEYGVRAGVVIGDLRRETARSERDLTDALKFYINTSAEKGTPEETYEANKTLVSFVPYNVRAGFAPDIESAATFAKYTQDLLENGFVSMSTSSKVELVTTPVENRIIKIVGKEGKAAQEAVKEEFIVCAQARNIFEDAYLNILEAKGLLTNVKGSLSLVRRDEALIEARRSFKAYGEQMNARRKLAEWQAFAHIFVTKQRDQRLIRIAELDNYITELHAQIEKSALSDSEAEVLQKVRLMSRLIEHLQTDLLPKIDGAIAKARDIIATMTEEVDSVAQELESLVEQYGRWTALGVQANNLKEYNELQAGKQRLLNELRAPMTTEELEKLAVAYRSTGVRSRGHLDREGFIIDIDSTKGLFSFDRWRDETCFFNLSLQKLQALNSRLEQQIKACRTMTEGANTKIEELEEEAQRTKSRLLTINVDTRLSVSQAVYRFLQEYVGARAVGAAAKQQPHSVETVLTLSDIVKDLHQRLVPLRAELGSANSLMDALGDLLKTEREFLDVKNRAAALYEVLRSQIDIEPYATDLNSLSTQIEKVQNGYTELTASLDNQLRGQELSPRYVGQAGSALNRSGETIMQVRQSLGNIWPRYITDCKEFIADTRTLLAIIQKQDPKIPAEAAVNKCEELSTGLASIDSEAGHHRMSSFEVLKDQVRQLVLELMKKSLDEEEGLILMGIVEKARSFQRQWLPVASMVDEITSSTGKPKEHIESLVRSLITKGYLSEGVSLPV